MYIPIAGQTAPKDHMYGSSQVTQRYNLRDATDLYVRHKSYKDWLILIEMVRASQFRNP